MNLQQCRTKRVNNTKSCIDLLTKEKLASSAHVAAMHVIAQFRSAYPFKDMLILPATTIIFATKSSVKSTGILHISQKEISCGYRYFRGGKKVFTKVFLTKKSTLVYIFSREKKWSTNNLKERKVHYCSTDNRIWIIWESAMSDPLKWTCGIFSGGNSEQPAINWDTLAQRKYKLSWSKSLARCKGLPCNTCPDIHRKCLLVFMMGSAMVIVVRLNELKARLKMSSLLNAVSSLNNTNAGNLGSLFLIPSIHCMARIIIWV